MEITTQRGERIIGTCKTFDNVTFQRKLTEYSSQYGYGNVWYKRDYQSQTITFFTN